MKVLVDMNLSPDWVPVLERQGHGSIHWSAVGNIRAHDDEIMAWAREKGYVLFTHDLDFGSTLALTQSRGPSVLQVRTQDVSPSHLESLVITALRQHENLLVRGAIVTVDEARSRSRILPIQT